MTAKQYLSQLQKMDVMIEHKREELCRLKSAVTKITPTLSDAGGGSGDSDRIGSMVAHIADLEAEISGDIDRLADSRHVMIRQIHELDSTSFSALLFKRYVEYKSLERISAEMHFEFGYIRKMHGRALQAFTRMHLPEEQEGTQRNT